MSDHIQMTFAEAIVTDPDMPPEDKIKWLKIACDDYLARWERAIGEIATLRFQLAQYQKEDAISIELLALARAAIDLDAADMTPANDEAAAAWQALHAAVKAWQKGHGGL